MSEQKPLDWSGIILGPGAIIDVSNIDEMKEVMKEVGVTTHDFIRNLGFESIETIKTPDGAICEIIDGYDVVPIHETEYSHIPLGVTWSLDEDKPTTGYVIV